MHRSVVVASSFAFVLALAPVARGQEKPAADWKWDALKWSKAHAEDKTVKVGYKQFTEGKEKDALKQVVTGPDGQEQKQDVGSELSFRYVEEIEAIDDGGHAKKTKVHVEKWSKKPREGDEDKSLEGKVIVVEREGETSTIKIQDDKGAEAEVTDAARQWAEGELTRKKKDGQDMDVILPQEPIAPDSTWKPDPAKVAQAMFGPDMQVDPEKSKATGKLSDVRIEKGTPIGKVTIELSLQLKTIPGTEAAWTEGGAFVVTVEYEGSLINNRRQKSEKMGVSFGGKGEVSGPGGTAKLAMKITNTKEAKSGRVKQ